MYVVPPESEKSSSESGSSESERKDPRKKLVDLARRERENSDEEDNTPKIELAKRIHERELRQNAENAYASDEMLSESDAD